MATVEKENYMLLGKNNLVKVNKYDIEKGYIDFDSVTGTRVIVPVDYLNFEANTEIELSLAELLETSLKRMHLTANLSDNEYVGIFADDYGNYTIGIGDLTELTLTDYDFEGLVPTYKFKDDESFTLPNYAYEELLDLL